MGTDSFVFSGSGYFYRMKRQLANEAKEHAVPGQCEILFYRKWRLINQGEGRNGVLEQTLRELQVRGLLWVKKHAKY